MTGTVGSAAPPVTGRYGGNGGGGVGETVTSTSPDGSRLPDGVLSAGAAALYEELLVRGGMELDTGCDVAGDADTAPGEGSRSAALHLTDPRVRELLARGFAAQPDQAPRWLAPVPPTTALEGWLTGLETDLRRRHAALTAAFDYLNELQRLFVRAQPFLPVDELVTVVTDADQVRVMSLAMRRAAREQLRVFDTPDYQKVPGPDTLSMPTPEERARGLVVRSVYRTDYVDSPMGLDVMRQSAQSGEMVRVRDRLPLKMLVADRHTALVALVPSGVEGALLVRAPIVVDALCDYFDLTWQQAVPWPDGGAGDGSLTATQRRVLGLMAAGVKDEAIARQCGMSVRTLRRQVSSLMAALGVTTRFAAGVEAVRRGFVGNSATAPRPRTSAGAGPLPPGRPAADRSGMAEL